MLVMAMILSNKDIFPGWRSNELLTSNKTTTDFVPWSWADSAVGAGFTKWTAPDEEILEPVEQIDAAIEASEPPKEVSDTTSKEEPEVPTVSMVDFDRAKQDYFEKGYSRGVEEAEQKWENTRETFSSLTQSIFQEQQKPTTFFEPLKILSLHIAKQLVRGELSLSSAAIERLIRGVLEDIQQKGPGPIVMSLNPQDLDKVYSNLPEDLTHLELRGNDNLSPGSVVLTLDNTAIEDLIEHRLDVLSESLFAAGSTDTVSASTTNNELSEKEESVNPQQGPHSRLAKDPQSPSDEANDA